MNIKEVILHLGPEENARLERILISEDKTEALLFLEECLKPRLDRATRDH